MAGFPAGRGAQSDELRVEGTSRVLVHVGKAGVFGFAGHDHEVEAPVTGSVSVDRADVSRSQVVLEFDAASLRVTGEGEPAEDVPEVQRTMVSERVLDVKRYPTVVFRSKRITGADAAGAAARLTVAGDLSLHGVTREVVVPVRVALEGDALTADGTVTIRQSDFGIQPVTAAGGTIRVKDALEISFRIRASR
jgi:polyisoprenoid-binding protein YceI